MSTPYPNWERLSCGCAQGMKYSVTGQPEECDMCNGSGSIWRHKPSRILAQWPGGPFLGKSPVGDKMEHDDTVEVKHEH